MPRVLVVDDDADLVALIARNFSDNGFQVVAAYDTLQATALAQKSPPDIIVMDFQRTRSKPSVRAATCTFSRNPSICRSS